MICRCGSKLDPRGFLFDQISVHNFFQGIKKTKLSCERLTVQFIKKMVQAIKLENPSCEIQRVKLTLSPAPFLASMTYSWSS